MPLKCTEHFIDFFNCCNSKLDLPIAIKLQQFIITWIQFPIADDFQLQLTLLLNNIALSGMNDARGE